MRDNIVEALSYLQKQDNYVWREGTTWQMSCVVGLTVDEIIHSSNVVKAIQERRGFNLSPRYRHDCNKCDYLGQYGSYDLYACLSKPTIVCRSSSEGSDYKSGLSFGLVQGADPEYIECVRRALLVQEYRESFHQYCVKFHRDPYTGSQLEKLETFLREAGYHVA